MAAIRTLVLVGGPYHDGPGARQELLEALRATGDVEATLTDDTSALASSELSEYEVLVVYTTGGELGPAEEQGLTDFVASGKGLVGLHGATTSFNASPAYMELIGSRFVKHPPFTEVAVRIVDHTHPATRGLADFIVPDELYELEYDPARFRVLAEARAGDLVQPSAYVKSYGKGRVFYCALGHDARCLRAEPFRRLLSQGLRWAAGAPKGFSG